jgi:L-threonylcarbamoyladenylate synthase
MAHHGCLEHHSVGLARLSFRPRDGSDSTHRSLALLATDRSALFTLARAADVRIGGSRRGWLGDDQRDVRRASQAQIGFPDSCAQHGFRNHRIAAYLESAHAPIEYRSARRLDRRARRLLAARQQEARQVGERMDEAVRIALAGGCIVYPTTTQPALGCIPEPAALDRLFALKKRSAEMPVSIGVADLSQAATLVELSDDLPAFLESFPEGSLTVILPAREPLDARLGGEKIAIRVVAHPLAKALLRRTGPLTATSANISGAPPSKTCEAAAASLAETGEKVGIVAGLTASGPPSTLIAWHSVCVPLECACIEVLREGIIPSEEVLTWWKNQTSNNGETLDM